MFVRIIKLFCFLLVLPSFLSTQDFDLFNLSKEAKYFFCVEGGGTKTELIVLDSKGQRQKIQNRAFEKPLDKLSAPSSNMSTLGKEKVKECLTVLFEGLHIEGQPVGKNLSESVFIGGFAGASSPLHQEHMKEIIEDLGFKSDHIGIFSDAALALEMFDGDGAILIGGTGSICFVKENDKTHRVGGIGYRIADKGSGYDIGLKGIRASIEYEYEYGKYTSLAERIKQEFELNSTKELIVPINQNKMTTSQIANVAEIVFEEAWNGDSVAYEILEKSAKELSSLLKTGLEKTHLQHPYTYLIGGIFKNEKADQFIEMILKSKPLNELSEDQKPLLINLSNAICAELFVKRAIQKSKSNIYNPLSSLPILEKTPDPDFRKKYDTSFISTEKKCEKASLLSSTFHADPLKGIEMLLSLDQSIFEGAKIYNENYSDLLDTKLRASIQKRGRLFLVGSGSSGRIATDLAAKWRSILNHSSPFLKTSYIDFIQAIIAGGPRSFVKAKEGFEDSRESGYDALKELQFNSNDIVILISASGSAQFNIGAADYASEIGGTCFYFYNSETVPQRTKLLFEENKAIPLLVDIGPQSISGSTRLQAASLAELCLGLSINRLLLFLMRDNRQFDLIENAKIAYSKVGEEVEALHKIIDLELDTFQADNANFRKICDETDQGYISFLSCEDALREIMVDSTETAPTFSTNPPRSIDETTKKKAEFRAYLIGANSNIEAWEKLIGRPFSSDEIHSLSHLLVSADENGFGAFNQRTLNKNNLVIGVLKSSLSSKQKEQLINQLYQCHQRGLKTALIVLEEENNPFDKEWIDSINFCNAKLHIQKLPFDPLGITSTLALKQVLNVISNASMIGMNKVYGNTMIDLSASNNKLIDRTIRIIQSIYSENVPSQQTLDYDLLFEYVLKTHFYKKLMEGQLGRYVPSCPKLVLTMIARNCGVNEAMEILSKHQENIDLILKLSNKR